MSSIKSSFNYDDFDYEPTIDSKFIDNLFLLILKGNVKEVKDFVSTILPNQDNADLNNTSDYNCDIQVNNSFICHEYNNNEVDYDDDLEDYDDSLESSQESSFLNLTFSNDYTPLMLVSQRGIPELVKYFIYLNCDINKSVKKTGLTALLAAAGSSANIINKEAHFENITKCIKILFDAGADITNKIIKTNQSALHLVAAENNVPSCKFLIDFIDINERNSKQCTPLMVAASNGYTEIVTILLGAGADVSCRNMYGFSAVELAMVNNHENVVKLLVRPSDNLDFYGAWSVVYQDIEEKEKRQNIQDSFAKKFYSSKYFSDPVACLCSSLNLTHLQPVLEKNGVTFSQLRSMSDSEMKDIGISKFSDRKCLLNLMQEVHKVGWIHQTSLYTPNYKLSITPFDMLDVVKNAYDHLEYLESTIEYMRHHLQTNSSYYLNYSQNKSFFEKYVNHCQIATFNSKNILDNIVKIDSIFDKMYQYAMEEDLSGQINDEDEILKQQKLTKRYSKVAKTGLLISGISIVAFVLIRSRFVHN